MRVRCVRHSTFRFQYQHALPTCIRDMINGSINNLNRNLFINTIKTATHLIRPKLPSNNKINWSPIKSGAQRDRESAKQLLPFLPSMIVIYCALADCSCVHASQINYQFHTRRADYPGRIIKKRSKLNNKKGAQSGMGDCWNNCKGSCMIRLVCSSGCAATTREAILFKHAWVVLYFFTALYTETSVRILMERCEF